MKPILYVEDDSNDVLFFEHAVKKTGLSQPVQVACDGKDAMDYLKGTAAFANREKFPLPCLVLLDLKSQRVTGLEVLKWIRQESGLPLVVVVLTASGHNADVTAAYRLGANAYLIKPTDAREFERMIKALIDFWLIYNTGPQESETKPRFTPASA